MSKKNKNLEEQTQVEQQDAEVVETEVKEEVVVQETKTDKKEDKKSKDKEKDKKKSKKKEKKNGGLGKKTRETMSELKKVTWPTFGEVVKKTGIVIAFVVLFGLFFYGVNALLGWLVYLLV